MNWTETLVGITNYLPFFAAPSSSSEEKHPVSGLVSPDSKVKITFTAISFIYAVLLCVVNRRGERGRKIRSLGGS